MFDPDTFGDRPTQASAFECALRAAEQVSHALFGDFIDVTGAFGFHVGGLHAARGGVLAPWINGRAMGNLRLFATRLEGRMREVLNVLLAVAAFSLIAGCGSQRLNYSPAISHINSREQAVEVIEQTFYEDYSKKFRPQSVVVTDKVILLSDGVISEGTAVGGAVPVGSAAIAVGSSKTVTKDATRRIYLNSIGDIAVFEKRGKSNRFVVVIRGSDGGTLATVRSTRLERAKLFADAILYLKPQK